MGSDDGFFSRTLEVSGPCPELSEAPASQVLSLSSFARRALRSRPEIDTHDGRGNVSRSFFSLYVMSSSITFGA